MTVAQLLRICRSARYEPDDKSVFKASRFANRMNRLVRLTRRCWLRWPSFDGLRDGGVAWMPAMRLSRPWRRCPVVPVDAMKWAPGRRLCAGRALRAWGRFGFLCVHGGSRSRDHGGARTWLLQGAKGGDQGGTYPKQIIGPPHSRQIIGGDVGMTSCSVQAR